MDEELNQETWAALATFLSDIGLGALFSINANGNPEGWLYDRVVEGITSESELLIALQSTPEFRERFSVIIRQQEAAAAGENVYVMSPGQVLEYERVVTSTMVANNLPSYLYDQPEDFANLILSGESAESISNKITQAYDFVDSAPQEVREAFNEFYGTEGDAAFAAYVLDPERTIASIDRAQRTAYAAGYGRRYELEISRDQAEDIADSARGLAGIEEGFREISAMQGVFEESVGEAGDLTAEETGVAQVFAADAEAQTAVERRLAQRQGVNRATVGGALLTQQGVTGLS